MRFWKRVWIFYEQEKVVLTKVLSPVETSTLLFFAGLFVMVNCVEELGVTIWIAEETANLIDLVPEVREIRFVRMHLYSHLPCHNRESCSLDLLSSLSSGFVPSYRCL